MAKKLLSVFGVQGDDDGTASAADASPTGAPKETAASGTRNDPSRSVMILGKTLVFKGELAADEDMVLLGRVEGSLQHSENLTIGIGGVVVGDVHARTITIKGTVEGDVEATESVTILPTANVVGDIVAPRVGIVEGAKFNGAVKMPVLNAVELYKAGAAIAKPPAALSDGEVEEKLLEG